MLLSYCWLFCIVCKLAFAHSASNLLINIESETARYTEKSNAVYKSLLFVLTLMLLATLADLP